MGGGSHGPSGLVDNDSASETMDAWFESQWENHHSLEMHVFENCGLTSVTGDPTKAFSCSIENDTKFRLLLAPHIASLCSRGNPNNNCTMPHRPSLPPIYYCKPMSDQESDDQMDEQPNVTDPKVYHRKLSGCCHNYGNAITHGLFRKKRHEKDIKQVLNIGSGGQLSLCKLILHGLGELYVDDYLFLFYILIYSVISKEL
ncbi:unnamed protein product [Trichobilharzia regenti]|nr:unnamed protein product [Trichobilharzia regenti]